MRFDNRIDNDITNSMPNIDSIVKDLKTEFEFSDSKLDIQLEETEKATMESVFADDDLGENEEEVKTIQIEEPKKDESLLDSIASAIDDLDDSADEKIEEIVDLPMDTTINVKSICFGGLTYKSRSTNAVFRWNQIGSIQPMTVAEINEMNNYKSA